MPCTICQSTTHNITTCDDPSIKTKHCELFNASFMYRDLIHEGVPGDNMDCIVIFNNILDSIRETPIKMLLKLYKTYANDVYIPNEEHPFLSLTDWYHRESTFAKQLINPHLLKYSIGYTRSHIEVLLIQTYFNMADGIIQGVRSRVIQRRQKVDYNFPIEFVTEIHPKTTPCLNQDCGICWDKLTDETRVYPSCEHGFCASCIESTMNAVLQKAYNENKPPSLSCPLCREEVTTLYHADDLAETLIVPLVNVVNNDLS